MVQTSESLRSQLQEFAQENRALLSKGKFLLEALDDPSVARKISKPLLLKLILEKYLELIDDKLLPALPQSDNLDASNPDLEACNGNSSFDNLVNESPTDPSIKASRVETLRASASSQRVEPTSCSYQDGVPLNLSQLTNECLVENPVGSRRTIPRYKCHMPLNYSLEGPGKAPVKAFTRNVGALGLFITAGHPQKVGDLIKIEVDVPEKGLAVLHGVVRWAKWVPQNLRSADLPGFGVKITSAPESWYSHFLKVPRASTL